MHSSTASHAREPQCCHIDLHVKSDTVMLIVLGNARAYIMHAYVYSVVYTTNVYNITNSFANGIRTADGGTHLDSLKAVITRTVNSLGKKSGKIKDTAGSIGGEFIREGLTAIIHVKVSTLSYTCVSIVCMLSCSCAHWHVRSKALCYVLPVVHSSMYAQVLCTMYAMYRSVSRA
jgi:DNA gyrase B